MYLNLITPCEEIFKKFIQIRKLDEKLVLHSGNYPQITILECIARVMVGLNFGLREFLKTLSGWRGYNASSPGHWEWREATQHHAIW